MLLLRRPYVLLNLNKTWSECCFWQYVGKVTCSKTRSPGQSSTIGLPRARVIAPRPSTPSWFWHYYTCITKITEITAWYIFILYCIELHKIALYCIRSLKALLEPMLAGLMELNMKKMWTFERFFATVEKLAFSVQLQMFSCCTGELMVLYVGPEDTCVKLVHILVDIFWHVRIIITYFGWYFIDKCVE